MTLKRVLITGATGFVGLRLHRDLSQDFQVIGTYRKDPPGTGGVEWIEFDADIHAPGDLIEESNPDAIIHLLALSRTEGCSSSPDMARQINTDLTLDLARIALNSRLRFLFTSTDQVFDGKKGDYSEVDRPHPTGVYARTKVEAEEGLCELFRNVPDLLTIFRLALSYGHSDELHPGPVGWIINSLTEGLPVNLFKDEIRSPLYIGDISRAMRQTLRNEYSGIYHLGGRDSIDRHSFGVRIAEKLGFPTDLCHAQSVLDYPGPEPRSPNCSFNVSKFIQTFGWTPMGVEEGLERILEDN